MPLERVTSRQPWKLPTAADHNAIVEAVEHYHLQQALGSPTDGNRSFIPSDMVKLKNSSGGNLVAGRVLEIGAKLITTPDRHHLWFTGGTPAPNGTKGIAILTRPMPTDAIDWCQVSGVCLCRININHVQQTRADVDSSSTLLQSKWHGRCEILWKSTASTGEQDAMVRIGEMFRGPIKGIAASGLARGSSATVAVQWAGAAASPASAVTVYFNWMDGGPTDVPTNGELVFFWHPDEQKYVLNNAECEHA